MTYEINDRDIEKAVACGSPIRRGTGADPNTHYVTERDPGHGQELGALVDANHVSTGVSEAYAQFGRDLMERHHKTAKRDIRRLTGIKSLAIAAGVVYCIWLGISYYNNHTVRSSPFEQSASQQMLSDEQGVRTNQPSDGNLRQYLDAIAREKAQR